MFLIWGFALNGFEISEEQGKYFNKSCDFIMECNRNVMPKHKEDVRSSRVAKSSYAKWRHTSSY